MTHYPVSLYQDEDGMWVAECPRVPGCISQGTTEVDARRNIAEAIRECLAVRAGLPSQIDTAGLAFCLTSTGCEASLTVGKAYTVLVDEDADSDVMIRVIDESGDDYLYPAT